MNTDYFLLKNNLLYATHLLRSNLLTFSIVKVKIFIFSLPFIILKKKIRYTYIQRSVQKKRTFPEIGIEKKDFPRGRYRKKKQISYQEHTYKQCDSLCVFRRNNSNRLILLVHLHRILYKRNIQTTVICCNISYLFPTLQS